MFLPGESQGRGQGPDWALAGLWLPSLTLTSILALVRSYFLPGSIFCATTPGSKGALPGCAFVGPQLEWGCPSDQPALGVHGCQQGAEGPGSSVSGACAGTTASLTSDQAASRAWPHDLKVVTRGFYS